MTHEEAIIAAGVMLAWAEGKKVQGRWRNSSCEWGDCSDPAWQWETNEYRIKPEPREWWLNDCFVGYGFKDAAKSMSKPGFEPIHVREVKP
jgi:hypothetical protein